MGELLRLSFTLDRTDLLTDQGVGCESCHGQGGDLLNGQGEHKKNTGQKLSQRRPVGMSMATQTCDRCHRLEPMIHPPEFYPPFSKDRPFVHGQRSKVRSDED